MGLFRDAGKVYKPAAEVDLGPTSDEFYIRPNVRAPRVAGLLVKIFVWILKSPILGPILICMLKKDNLIQRLVSSAEIKEPPLFTPAQDCQDKISIEQNVSLIKPNLSPAERVDEAANCLPASSEATLAHSSFHSERWTIRDFAMAYRSGQLTPLAVAKRFLSAVEDSENPKLNMAFFISYSPEDIIRQAAES